jgi:hypothetical protein
MFPGGMEVGQEELEALGRVIESKNLFRYYGVGKGPDEVASFEREFAELMGAKHALCLNAGSSALICALIGAGVGEGDEVIVPAYTWDGTATAVLFAGGVPILITFPSALVSLLSAATRKRQHTRIQASISFLFIAISFFESQCDSHRSDNSPKFATRVGLIVNCRVCRVDGLEVTLLVAIRWLTLRCPHPTRDDGQADFTLRQFTTFIRHNAPSRLSQSDRRCTERILLLNRGLQFARRRDCRCCVPPCRRWRALRRAPTSAPPCRRHVLPLRPPALR